MIANGSPIFRVGGTLHLISHMALTTGTMDAVTFVLGP